jgi:hypothetical protein
VLTQTKSFDNEGEVNEGGKHDIEFVEAGKDTPEAFQAAEEAFNLVAPLIHFPVIFPRGKPVWIWGNYREKTKIQSQLAGFITFVSPIHNQTAAER